MTVRELIDELERFHPSEKVGVELGPEDFQGMDEEALTREVESVQPGNIAFDGCRIKLTLGDCL